MGDEATVKTGKIPQVFPGEGESPDVSEEDLKAQYALDEDNRENKLKKHPEAKKKSKGEKYDDGDPIDDDEPSGKDQNDDDDDDDDTQDDDDEIEFDEALIDRAIDAGMEPEDIEDYSSEAKLLKHVRILERAQKRNSRDGDDDDKPSRKSDDKKPSSKDSKGDDEDPEFKVDLDPELYDPKTVETIKNLNKHYHGKVKELMNTISQLTERLDQGDAREQQKVLRENMDIFDSQIAELCSDKDDGEFWKETFGEDGHLGINKKSKAFKNRNEVWTEMRALAKADSELGRRSDLKTLFKKAMNLIYADRADKKAKFSLSKKIKGTKRTFISRPNQKGKSDMKPGKDAAVAFADEFLNNLKE